MTSLSAPEVSGTSSWLLIATMVLGNGTGIGLLLTGLFNRRKTRAEAVKTDAETGMTTATSTEALVRTSLSLLQPYTEGLARFSEEAQRLRVENEALHAAQARLRGEYEELQLAYRRMEVLLLELQRSAQTVTGGLRLNLDTPLLPPGTGA